MVIPGQLEVRESDGDETSHDHQHDEREEQDAEEGVYLVPPNGCEDVVQLDVYGGEREEAGHEQLGQRMAVPVLHVGHLTSAKRREKR